MIYGILALFALVYLVPLLVVVLELVPRPAGDRAERAHRLAAELRLRRLAEAWARFCVGGTCEGMRRYFWNSLR